MVKIFRSPLGRFAIQTDYDTVVRVDSERIGGPGGRIPSVVYLVELLMYVWRVRVIALVSYVHEIILPALVRRSVLVTESVSIL
jgi:hypothetical protein